MDKQGFVDGRQGAFGVQWWNTVKGEMVDTGKPELKQLGKILAAGRSQWQSIQWYVLGIWSDVV